MANTALQRQLRLEYVILTSHQCHVHQHFLPFVYHLSQTSPIWCIIKLSQPNRHYCTLAWQYQDYNQHHRVTEQPAIKHAVTVHRVMQKRLLTQTLHTVANMILTVFLTESCCTYTRVVQKVRSLTQLATTDVHHISVTFQHDLL